MLKTKKFFLVLALAALSLCSMYTIGCAAVTEQQAMVGGEVAADVWCRLVRRCSRVMCL